MGEILKKSFSIINKNFWLLFLFMTVCYLGLVYFGILQASVNKPIEMIVGLITLLFLTVAGVAGVFGTIRATIKAYDKNADVSKMELLKVFPKSVGEYFFSALGLVLLYLFISLIYFGILFTIGDNLIGKFSFSLDELANSLNSPDALIAFQKTLTADDYSKFTKWYTLYFLASSVLTYCLIYWLPETFYKTKNTFVSLFKAIIKGVMHPVKTLILFLTLFLINFITSLVFVFISAIPVLNLLAYFVYFYSLLLVLIHIFNYYDYNFGESAAKSDATGVREEDINDDGKDE